MSEYITVNILDMAEVIGEESLNKLLSDFSCPKNLDIERFVKVNALDFARRKISITHLVLDEDGILIAIFTIAHKALVVMDNGLNANIRKKIKRFAQIDEIDKSYTLSAFLIAQFGKSECARGCVDFNGDRLMDKAFDVLNTVQHNIGGGVVYLDCEDNQKLLEFYQNENNNFKVFGDRYSTNEDIHFKQLLRLF